MNYTFTVPGPPTGKGRPQFVRATGRAVTPKATRLAESRVLHAWTAQDMPRIDIGAVAIEVEAVLERPQGHYKTAGDLSAAGRRSHWPTKTPDADNLLKLVMDSLNKFAYRDDAQVVHAWVVKRWANPGETEHLRITVRSMPVLQALREKAA